jgi:prolyl oligopeptidase
MMILPPLLLSLCVCGLVVNSLARLDSTSLLGHQSISNVEESSVLLKELMNRAVNAKMSFQPSFNGLRKHSLEHFNKFRGIFESIGKEATELLPKLNGSDFGECQNLIDVVRGQLALPLSEYSYYLPCLSTRSTPKCLPKFLFDDLFPKVFSKDQETFKQNVLKYVSNHAELESLPSGLNDLSIAYTKGLEAKITLPRSDVNLVMDSLYGILVCFQALEDSNLTLVNEILNSINNLKKFIEETYLIHVLDSPRISDYPNPGSIYQGHIIYHTSTDMTAQELHDLGLSEISRIEKTMETTKKNIGYNGTLQEFQKDLNDKTKYPELFAKDENDFFGIYRKTVADLYNLLPNYFEVEDIPKKELRLARINTGSALYANGTFYLNLRLLGNSPVHRRVALSIHEGVPGHHLHVGLQTERSANMNEFYNIYFSTSYTEGWALYTEYLGEEMGAYTNEFLYFGRLDYEMLRAVRLVVDTGLHAFDWSEQRAVDFLLSKTSFSESEAREQVQRYVRDPGQALGYKIGELNILKMRKKAQEMLGNAFDIKKFHKVVLDKSNISVKAVEAMVNAWIAGGGAGNAA